MHALGSSEPLVASQPCAPPNASRPRRTGILIGVHGAALTFVASTAAGESALLELAGLGWEDTQTGNMLNLFPSLAHNVGAYYEQVRAEAGPRLEPAGQPAGRRVLAWSEPHSPEGISGCGGLPR